MHMHCHGEKLLAIKSCSREILPWQPFIKLVELALFSNMDFLR